MTADITNKFPPSWINERRRPSSSTADAPALPRGVVVLVQRLFLSSPSHKRAFRYIVLYFVMLVVFVGLVMGLIFAGSGLISRVIIQRQLSYPAMRLLFSQCRINPGAVVPSVLSQRASPALLLTRPPQRGPADNVDHIEKTPVVVSSNPTFDPAETAVPSPLAPRQMCPRARYKSTMESESLERTKGDGLKADENARNLPPSLELAPLASCSLPSWRSGATGFVVGRRSGAHPFEFSDDFSAITRSRGASRSG